MDAQQQQLEEVKDEGIVPDVPEKANEVKEEPTKVEVKVEVKAEDEVKLEKQNDLAEKQEQAEKINKFKKRKVALYFGYYGAKYQGLQRNEGAHTIEDVLEEAIHKAGGISDDNFGTLSKISWARAARTDKGVSAACSVVSLKMIVEPPGMIERINEHLPQDVKAFGFMRVAGSFDARKICDRRRYSYVLPLWAIDVNYNLDARKKSKATNGEKRSTSYFASDGESELLRDNFERLLQQYKGTQNFHGFTKNVAYNKSEAKRFIISWKVELFELDGEKFVRCEVVGQSFLYHQIRKMIGLALAVVRGIAPAESLSIALNSKRKFNVPLAPETSLLLEECIFDSYNKKFKKSHAKLTREEFMLDVDSFRKNVIQKNMIAGGEFQEGMLNWLKGLTDELHEFSSWKEWSENDTPPVRESKDGFKTKSQGKRIVFED